MVPLNTLVIDDILDGIMSTLWKLLTIVFMYIADMICAGKPHILAEF